MIKATAVAMVLVMTAAVAQAPVAHQTSSRNPDNDPHKVVCVKEKEIGSRLATRRVCRTRAEWAEHREQTRQIVEKVQANPSKSN